MLPDLICLGKGLGGGLPISACVGADEVMQSWRREPARKWCTPRRFTVPPGCATAIATLEALRVARLPERAAEVGARFKSALAKALRDVPGVGEFEGRGS